MKQGCLCRLLCDRKLISIAFWAAGVQLLNAGLLEKAEMVERRDGSMLLVSRKWAGGNYSWPLFSQNGLDKDWYCNSAFISVSFSVLARFAVPLSFFLWKWFCVWIVSIWIVWISKWSDSKRRASEIHHGDEMRWGETTPEPLAGGLWETNTILFNLWIVRCQSWTGAVAGCSGHIGAGSRSMETHSPMYPSLHVWYKWLQIM